MVLLHVVLNLSHMLLLMLTTPCLNTELYPLFPNPSSPSCPSTWTETPCEFNLMPPQHPSLDLNIPPVELKHRLNSTYPIPNSIVGFQLDPCPTTRPFEGMMRQLKSDRWNSTWRRGACEAHWKLQTIGLNLTPKHIGLLKLNPNPNEPTLGVLYPSLNDFLHPKCWSYPCECNEHRITIFDVKKRSIITHGLRHEFMHLFMPT